MFSKQFLGHQKTVNKMKIFKPHAGMNINEQAQIIYVCIEKIHSAFRSESLERFRRICVTIEKNSRDTP
jgi:hypothetical protein